MTNHFAVQACVIFAIPACPAMYDLSCNRHGHHLRKRSYGHDANIKDADSSWRTFVRITVASGVIMS